MRAALAIVLAMQVVTSVSEPDLSRVGEAARGEIAAGTMPGMAVAIVHQGRVIFSEGFGVANVETGAPVTPATVFQVGSVGKMLTAAAVLETHAAGAIALNRRVGDVIAGLAPSIGALTPHQLLAHVSGLRDMPGEHGEQGDDAHGRFLRRLTPADRILAPGQTFSYSNIGYSLAGLAAAEAMRLPFADLVRQRVLGPVGMTRSTLRPVEAMTWPLALGHRKTAAGAFTVVRPTPHDTRLWPAGYVFTTAADLARFAVVMLAAGKIDGTQALSPDTPRRMLEPHVKLPNLYDDGHYGYATFQFTMRGQRVAEHAGSMVGSAAILRMVPEQRFAVIALSNGDALPVRTAEAAMEALLPLTAPAPFTSDGPPVAMTPGEMASYVGRYENRGDFAIALENGSLVARQNGGPPLAVTKVGDHRFVAAGPGNRPRLRLLIMPAADGRPAYLHFSLWGFRKTS